MTTTDPTNNESMPPLPPSRTLALHMEQKFYDLGDVARKAVDEVFLGLQADGWHYDYGPSYSEPISETIENRLEWMAGQAIQEQLSKAVLAFWIQQRRVSQHECEIEESIGCLFSGLAFVVSGLIGDAVEGLRHLVGPAADAEKMTA